MSFTLQNPFQYWNNPNNSNPIGLGRLYVGLPDTDPEQDGNRVTVKAVQQNGTEITLAQPVQLLAGGVPAFNGAPVQLKIENAEVSIKVTTMQGAQVYYAARYSLADNSIIFKSVSDMVQNLSNSSAVGLAVSWLGYYESGDGGDGFGFVRSGSYIANGGSIIAIKPGLYVEQILEGFSISVNKFGARANNLSVSSRVQIQSAIDYCNSFNPAKSMMLSGRYRVDGQLFIDRAVDTTTGEFIVRGSDESTGFYVNNIPANGSVFSSRLPYGPAGSGYTKHPCTEFSTFYDVAFINDSTTPNIQAFDDKYLRLELIGCKFRNIAIIHGDQYLQTIRVDRCKTKLHVGYLVDCGDSYDVKFTRNTVESGFGGVYNRGNARALQVDFNLAQSNTGPLLRLASGNFSFCKNYTESNTEYCLLGVDGGSFGPCDVSGNIFFLSAAQSSDPSFYPISSDRAVKISLNDNVSTGNLMRHVNTRAFAINTDGNTCGAGRMILNVASDWSSIDAIAGGQSDVNPILTLNVNIVGSVVGGGIILPSTPVFFEQEQPIRIFNNSSNTVNVFPSVGERVRGAAYNSPITVAPNASVTLLSEKTDTWRII